MKTIMKAGIVAIILTLNAAGSEPWIQNAGGGFVFNHGAVFPAGSDLTFTNQGIRDLTISAGQLCGVCPETGVVITNRLDLLPLRAQSLESDGDVVAGGVFYGDASGLWNIPAAALAGTLPSTVLPQDLSSEATVAFYEIHTGHDMPRTVEVSGVADAANGVYYFGSLSSTSLSYFKDRYNWIWGWRWGDTAYWELVNEAGYYSMATAPADPFLPPQTGWSDPDLVVTYGPARFTVIDGGRVQTGEVVAERIILGGESISSWSDYHGDQSVNTTDEVEFRSIQLSCVLPEETIPVLIRVSGWTDHVADANATYIRGDNSNDDLIGYRPSIVNSRPAWYQGGPMYGQTRIFFNGTEWEFSGVTGVGYIRALAPDFPRPPKSGWTVIEGTGNPILEFFGTRIDGRIIQGPAAQFDSGWFSSLTLNGETIGSWSEFPRGDQPVRKSDSVLFSELVVCPEIPRTITVAGWTYPVEANTDWVLGDDSPGRPSSKNGKPVWYHPMHDNSRTDARIAAQAGGGWVMAHYVSDRTLYAVVSGASTFPPETGWIVLDGVGQPSVSVHREGVTWVSGHGISSDEGVFTRLSLSGDTVSHWSEVGEFMADQPLSTTDDVVFASVTTGTLYFPPQGDLSMGSYTNGWPR